MSHWIEHCNTSTGMPPSKPFHGWRRSEAQSAAIEALGNLGSKGVKALISALSNEIESVRENAGHTLGVIGEPVAKEALERALNDASEDVRTDAEEALWTINSKKSDKRRKIHKSKA